MLEWHDMLGMEIDPKIGCWQVMREVHRRLGLTSGCDDPLLVRTAHLEHYEKLGPTWRSAVRLGDFLVGCRKGEEIPGHVSVLVDLPTRTVLSSGFRHDGIRRPFSLHASQVACQHGVWRPRS